LVQFSFGVGSRRDKRKVVLCFQAFNKQDFHGV
jgi:hypothetical protein